MSVARNNLIHVCVLMQRVYTQIAGNLTVFYGWLSLHGGSLRYEGIGQIQNLCYSERGEPRLLFGYKFVGLP